MRHVILAGEQFVHIVSQRAGKTDCGREAPEGATVYGACCTCRRCLEAGRRRGRGMGPHRYVVHAGGGQLYYRVGQAGDEEG